MLCAANTSLTSSTLGSRKPTFRARLYEQQTATAEVLQVINSSTGRSHPCFRCDAGKAMRLCEASFGNMTVYDGMTERSVAVHGAPEFARWLAARGSVKPAPGSVGDRLVGGEQGIHILDAASDPTFITSPTRRAAVEIGGFRTLLAVALRQRRGVAWCDLAALSKGGPSVL